MERSEWRHFAVRSPAARTKKMKKIKLFRTCAATTATTAAPAAGLCKKIVLFDGGG